MVTEVSVMQGLAQESLGGWWGDGVGKGHCIGWVADLQSVTHKSMQTLLHTLNGESSTTWSKVAMGSPVVTDIPQIMRT